MIELVVECLHSMKFVKAASADTIQKKRSIYSRTVACVLLSVSPLFGLMNTWENIHWVLLCCCLKGTILMELMQ